MRQVARRLSSDYRLATPRAKQLVTSVRQHGWAGAVILPTSHGRLTLEDVIVQYHRSAVSRSLRPRSIEQAKRDLRRIAGEIGARRLGDLTPEALQSWIRDWRLKSISLQSVLKNAATVFCLRSVRCGDRATEFKQRCEGLGIKGVTLHSYRYAWAERAKQCGYPERFAQEALGHNSKAVHRAYARKAQVRLPSLESYERQAAEGRIIQLPQLTSGTQRIGNLGQKVG